MNESAQRNAKISVKSLWKVYGPTPQQFFSEGQRIESKALVQQIREANHIPAVADISFEIAEGENFVIMGLSGSGKSTVVRCITRLIEPTRGKVLLDGEDILAASNERLVELRRHKMGMVFQNFGLLPHLTVLENVAFPLKVQGVDVKTRHARALEMIELVSLKGREGAYPRELSGGQQQRVGIARSLAIEPDIWLLDEPFSALDPLIRRQMQDEFLHLQQKLRKTLVFITHDFLEAIRIADRICILRDGQVAQIGTAEEIVLNPANEYVAKFTTDIPIAHILTVGSIMSATDKRDGTSTGSAHRNWPTIHQKATLDDAFRLFQDGVQQLLVTPSENSQQIVGRLTPHDLVKAMGKRRTA